jgi:lamin tail-like protein
MRVVRALALGAICFLLNAESFGDVVINEFLIDDRAADSARQHPSDREFVELYNSGGSSVDISGWVLKTIEMGNRWNTANGVTTYTLPANTSIPAGGFLVLAQSTNPDADVVLAPALKNGSGAISGDLFPDGDTATGLAGGTNRNFVFELRNLGAVLQDAVAVETATGVERDRITPEQLPFTGGGIWTDILSTEVPTGAPTFNAPATMSRYQNGLRTGGNGRDFGFLPATPGTSNNLPLADSVPGGTADGIYVVPNVNSLATETPLGNAYGMYGSFVVPVVAEPHVLDGIVVQKATNSPPPVGTKAIVNYDPSGGGNSVHVKNLVNSFDIYTYIDTDDYNLLASHPDDSFFAEWTAYGIGTTDPFVSSWDEAQLVPSSFTRSGNTGVGWTIEKVERNFGSGPETRTVLQLVNFGDGGDSVADVADPFPTWEIIQEFDLSNAASAWHRLSISYEASTNTVTARYDGNVYQFTYNATSQPGDFNLDGTVDAADYVLQRKAGGDLADFVANFGESGGGLGPDLVGSFYAGYRDGLDDSDSLRHFEVSRPATWLQYQAAGSGGGAVPEPHAMALVLVGVMGIASGRRER